MDITKKIGKTGGFTIPAHLRRELGIQGGEKVNLKVATDGSIVLKRVHGACVICGGYEGLKAFGKKFVCESCKDGIIKL